MTWSNEQEILFALEMTEDRSFRALGSSRDLLRRDVRNSAIFNEPAGRGYDSLAHARFRLVHNLEYSECSLIRSSGLGSLVLKWQPVLGVLARQLLGYNSSNAAVNMLIVQLAAELRNTGIKVNSADRGFTATDLNAHRGRQTIPEGAAAAVRLASSAEGRSHRRLFQRQPSGAVVTPNS